MPQWGRVLVAIALAGIALVSGVFAQGLGQRPFAGPSSVLGAGLDLAPSNPLGLPGSTGGLPRGANSLYLSDGMFRDILGPIPGFRAAYLYDFGQITSTGRLTLAYFHPFALTSDSSVFGEAHGEFTDFWHTISSLTHALTQPSPVSEVTSTKRTGSVNERVDLSFGAGYRRLFGEELLLGINGFYDTSRVSSQWYGSGSLGLEARWLLPGSDALDLTFNWYGDLFSGSFFSEAFCRGPANFDLEAGYSHQVWAGGPDLRFHGTGYRFATGSGVYGWRAGYPVRRATDGFASPMKRAAILSMSSITPWAAR